MHATATGGVSTGFVDQLRSRLGRDAVSIDVDVRAAALVDHSWLSPVLPRRLPATVADVVVCPADTDDVVQAVGAPCRHRVPVQPRGKGTGNDGQAVPFAGGMVLDTQRCAAIRDLGQGWLEADAVVSFVRLETAARATGQELAMFPTTVRSSLAGFLNSGAGGIGPLENGLLWDGRFVQELEVVPCWEEPEPMVVTAESAGPFLHAYGTTEVITAARVALVPACRWTALFAPPSTTTPMPWRPPSPWRASSHGRLDVGGRRGRQARGSARRRGVAGGVDGVAQPDAVRAVLPGAMVHHDLFADHVGGLLLSDFVDEPTLRSGMVRLGELGVTVIDPRTWLLGGHGGLEPLWEASARYDPTACATRASFLGAPNPFCPSVPPMGTPAATRARGTDIVDAVRALGGTIDAEADAIEREGRLGEPLVAALRAAGVFSMYAPSWVGGAEVDPLTAFEVVAELARHDGSVAWCAQVAAAVTTYLAWIDPAGVAAMTADTGTIHLAGSARALGTAQRVEGGYLARGHWNYASGIRHANWFLGTCEVTRADGSVTGRSMFVPVGDGEVVANWNVLGMRGTGSDDFVLDEVFVPEARTASRRWIADNRSPLYDPRLNMVAAWAPTAGVGVGLAQGALDALDALGSHSTAGSPLPLRQREAVQDAAGRARAMLGASRAYVRSAIAGAWQAVLERPDGATDATVTRAVTEAQLAITASLNEAVRVADLVFHSAGTAAISTANRLERILRDAHTAVQHAAGQPIHYRAGGRVALGLEPGQVDLTRASPTTPRP